LYRRDEHPDSALRYAQDVDTADQKSDIHDRLHVTSLECCYGLDIEA